MTDHKFTDDEIVLALKLCNEGADDACALCPYANTPNCYHESGKDSLALINRQKAEIERLQSMNQAKLDMIHDLRTDIETARAEAIKEFADNVVQELWSLNWHYGQIPCSEEDKTIQRAIKECIAEVERNTKVMTEENK